MSTVQMVAFVSALALCSVTSALCQTAGHSEFGSVDPRSQKFASMASSSAPLDPTFVPLLRELLADPRESVRVDALLGVAVKARAVLLTGAENPERKVLAEAWTPVRGALEVPEERVRQAAIRAIRVMGGEPVPTKPGLFTINAMVAALLADRYFREPAPMVRAALVEVFRMSDEQAAGFKPVVERVLQAATTDDDAAVVAASLYARSARKDEADLRVAADLLTHSSPRVRLQAVQLLASARESARPFASQLRRASNEEPDETVKKTMLGLLLLIERQ